ncbi:MAG: circularly permuted type 2 ATP-grasp protein, partial [Microcystaceae cyanobacterium]
MTLQLDRYDPEAFYDELFMGLGQPRPQAAPLIEWLEKLPPQELQQHHETAQLALFNLGVTFRVYSDQQGVDRIFPFDIIPRIIDAAEWQWLEKALKQRIRALNLFLADVYGDQKIIHDG